MKDNITNNNFALKVGQLFENEIKSTIDALMFTYECDKGKYYMIETAVAKAVYEILKDSVQPTSSGVDLDAIREAISEVVEIYCE